MMRIRNSEFGIRNYVHAPLKLRNAASGVLVIPNSEFRVPKSATGCKK